MSCTALTAILPIRRENHIQEHPIEAHDPIDRSGEPARGEARGDEVERLAEPPNAGARRELVNPAQFWTAARHRLPRPPRWGAT